MTKGKDSYSLTLFNSCDGQYYINDKGEYAYATHPLFIYVFCLSNFILRYIKYRQN
ncbi:conserved hypothetical protein [Xenorhabdus nematophila F1]|uniref:Uncharacterized protein n=1 Tax=Xenorhabdus nematophila (strain ATCC 19061 / DSM 3370 / CCUG 14189 / LMG 1036 / NCIMB 9965 / AN6) TaxID=406817 RepID=D3VK71_XENNA|nr:transcriptional regulator [Xenorhabdus nematophila]CBJ88823.1 hypothetical protein XNC1_0752 [Xenorhabdus nematophila ATCC 19061]CCW30824.1 conserved hypothetical protein [Xenorhabdus nematophila F1]CEE92570.1 hypothetical protein XNA1_2990007 [Xenorhabdus nematophila str. Anatoliense]CEF30230.1 hypothetical protein XNW1_2370014 [Xenorhabdus nematophila str. Websteri]CEK21737.1 hypothetical protein XNC2_0741 [Xenorhabdus nematophila AN6/1]